MTPEDKQAWIELRQNLLQGDLGQWDLNKVQGLFEQLDKSADLPYWDKPNATNSSKRAAQELILMRKDRNREPVQVEVPAGLVPTVESGYKHETMRFTWDAALQATAARVKEIVPTLPLDLPHVALAVVHLAHSLALQIAPGQGATHKSAGRSSWRWNE
jgi:hypothetical protein